VAGAWGAAGRPRGGETLARAGEGEGMPGTGNGTWERAGGNWGARRVARDAAGRKTCSRPRGASHPRAAPPEAPPRNVRRYRRPASAAGVGAAARRDAGEAGAARGAARGAPCAWARPGRAGPARAGAPGQARGPPSAAAAPVRAPGSAGAAGAPWRAPVPPRRGAVGRAPPAAWARPRAPRPLARARCLGGRRWLQRRR
jgi:hypothetical protein